MRSLIRAAGLRAPIPFYRMAERVPRFAAGARRLGLVWLEEMVGALIRRVENPAAEKTRVLERPDIRNWNH
jgi:uncharacterized protein YbjT (DUF2867 family)